jgi:hypothetical protein
MLTPIAALVERRMNPSRPLLHGLFRRYRKTLSGERRTLRGAAAV